MYKVRTALAGAILLAAMGSASAQAHRHRHVSAEAARPLTIGGHHRGIYRVGNDIVAPGGFSAHGYGYPVATAADRRAAYNASIRAQASTLYGAGVDGVGGFGFDDDPEAGYDNPYYGNTFNSYVGYDGVPSQLAFGPGYAMRHITGHDPAEDLGPPPPSPAQLGYSVEPDE